MSFFLLSKLINHHILPLVICIDPTNRRILYLEAKTPDLGIQIGIATACNINGVKPESGVTAKSCADEESMTEELSFHIRKGERYLFNRYISIYTSRELKQGPEADCINGIQTAMRYGVSNLLKRHSGAWGRRWECSDIRIEGDPAAQRALRFDIYHLLTAAPPRDIDVSIAAKTLSGEWYKGHIFWDTEIHTLPFFTYTQPSIAKDLLRYRYRRLQQAKDGARAQGYQGALWPWESAASGRDETRILPSAATSQMLIFSASQVTKWRSPNEAAAAASLLKLVSVVLSGKKSNPPAIILWRLIQKIKGGWQLPAEVCS